MPPMRFRPHARLASPCRALSRITCVFWRSVRRPLERRNALRSPTDLKSRSGLSLPEEQPGTDRAVRSAGIAV